MIDELPEAIAEIQQSRSAYQLERFVVGQHDTAEMRYFQICIELQDMLYKLAHARLSLQRGEVQVERLRLTGDAIDAIDADIAELELAQTRLAVVGAEREVAILRSMFATSPKFTRAEIEAAQPDYWQTRLSRQFELQRAAGGVGWAQLDSMLQAGMLTEVEQGSSVEVKGIGV